MKCPICRKQYYDGWNILGACKHKPREIIDYLMKQLEWCIGTARREVKKYKDIIKGFTEIRV